MAGTPASASRAPVKASKASVDPRWASRTSARSLRRPAPRAARPGARAPQAGSWAWAWACGGGMGSSSSFTGAREAEAGVPAILVDPRSAGKRAARELAMGTPRRLYGPGGPGGPAAIITPVERSPATEWLPPRAPGGAPPPRWVPEGDGHVPAAFEHPAFAPPSDRPPPPSTWDAAPAGARSPTAPRGAAVSEPGNDTATASLVLAITGLAFLLLGLGLAFVVNLPCSIAAWILGARGVQKVDRGETRQMRGIARAGQLAGIVGVALGLLAVTLWIVYFATGHHLDLKSDGSVRGNPDVHLDTARILAETLRTLR